MGNLGKVKKNLLPYWAIAPPAITAQKYIILESQSPEGIS